MNICPYAQTFIGGIWRRKRTFKRENLPYSHHHHVVCLCDHSSPSFLRERIL